MSVLSVDRISRALGRLPALSTEASRLLAALSRRQVEGDELVALIERDPMLAVRVLELANSGAFGRLRRFQSIRHAVMFIGQGPLRRHAIGWTIGAVLKRLPDTPYWSTIQFSMHSDAVALLTDSLCGHLPISGGDGAVIAGLLHDLGKFVICAEAPDALGTIQSLRAMGSYPVTECEREVIGIDHAAISCMAAEKWRLPEAVCEAIHCHHDLEMEDETAGLTLTAALAKSDAFVNSLGLSFLSPRIDPGATIRWPGHEAAVARSLECFSASLETVNA